MIKNITLTGNAETVGYAVDSIKDKKIRYQVEGAADSFRFDEYEVLSISLVPSKGDPYHLIAKIQLKGKLADIGLLRTLVSKTYNTLAVKG
jgi:hypothetical protein